MKLLPVILVCLLAIGCELIGEKDDKLLSGEVQSNVLKVDYSTQEKTDILKAINTYEAFNAKWGEMTDEALTLLINGEAQLFEDYDALREQYFIVENLVIANWHKYDAKTQAELRGYQRDAVEVDKKMRRAASVETAKGYAEVVLGLILKML